MNFVIGTYLWLDLILQWWVYFFFWNDNVNTQSVRFWCDSNSYIFKMNVTQWIKKINSWAENLGKNVIGPLFYRENLCGVAYLKMLKSTIDSLISQVIENLSMIRINKLFQKARLYFNMMVGLHILTKACENVKLKLP